MNRNFLHEKAYLLLSVAIAFILPININWVPALIIVLLINFFIEGKFKEKLNFKNKKQSYLFISLYIFYLAGMLWTNNISKGLFDLQIKLSVLIFPILFLVIHQKQDEFRLIILSGFVAGAFVSLLICFARAGYYFLFYNNNYFTYSSFSFLLHPAYLSMYLNFALVIVVYYRLTGLKLFYFSSKKLDLLLTVFFSIAIILLASKVGILLLFLTGISALVFISLNKRKLFLALIIGSASIIIFIISVFLFPQISERFENALYISLNTGSIEKSSSGSSAARILVWEAAVEVIKENFITGAGTGDAKDVLVNKYKELGMEGVFEKRLNAHNQFFQTTIALGIGGGVLLLLNFIIPFIKSFKKKDFIYFFFLFISFLNFLPEAMLEVQAGVIFYAFFNSLLYNTCPKNISIR